MYATKLPGSYKNLVEWVRKGFGIHHSQLRSIQHERVNIVHGNFCSNESELEQTINATPSQETIFNSWHRFSHTASGNYPAIPGELTAWVYDNGSVNNTTNSSSYIGTVSTGRYDDYLLDVEVHSTDGDDDIIGLVAAWYKDPITGKEYTISVLRSPGGIAPLYGIAVNYGQGATGPLWNIANGNKFVKWGNGADGALSATEAGYTSNDRTMGWLAQATKHGGKGHVRIRIERKGNIIRTWTSDWADPDNLDGTELMIDLRSDPRLDNFIGPSSYGFSASSQAKSFWNVREFTSSDNLYYLFDDRTIYRRVNGEMEDVSGEESFTFPPNTLLINPLTGKVFFFRDDRNIIQMGGSFELDFIPR